MDMQSLALALYQSSKDVQDKVFNNLPSELAELLKEKMANLGNVSQKQIEDAQKEFIQFLQQLKHQGKIDLPDKLDLEFNFKTKPKIYFPFGTLIKKGQQFPDQYVEIEKNIQQSKISCLLDLQEPSFYEKKQEQTILYRFLYFPPFDEPAISIRLKMIEPQKEGILIGKRLKHSSTKHLTMKTKSNMTELSLKTIKRLTQKEITVFFKLIQDCFFWRKEALEYANILDGEEWLLEGYDSGQYHVIYRHSNLEDNLKKLYRYLVKLAGDNFYEYYKLYHE